jgi:hypothetical protein
MTLVGGRGLAPPLGAPIEGGTLDEETARDLMNAMADVLATQPQAAYGAAMQDAFLRAQHGNVNIYSVDPGGLGGLGAFLQTRVRRGIGLPMMTPAEAFQEARMHRDFLRTVADNSGGRAILDSNDLASGIAQIFRENSSYYLIGYRSTRAPADRTIRRVTVRVRQPGLTAHTRNAYYDPRTRPRRLPAAGSPGLREALAGILPNPDIAMRASVAPFLVPGRRETGLAVVLGVRHPPLPGDIGARATGTLELLTSAFTPTGDPRKTVRQTATIVGRAGATEEAEYDLLSQIELPPGRYQLRVAAHSPALGKSGSVYLEVHVPDFSKEDVSLSGILLGATPSPAAAPADAFAGVLPIVPTSQREFQRGSEVIVFFRVYQRGRSAARPIAVTVRVANDHDSVVARSTATLDAAQFRDGAADYQFRLPVDQLQTGQYLLTVEAALGGRVARRDVRFERR